MSFDPDDGFFRVDQHVALVWAAQRGAWLHPRSRVIAIVCLLLLTLFSFLTECGALGSQSNPTYRDANSKSQPQDSFLALPSLTNSVQFHLYTNLLPGAEHLFNTFEITGFGQTLLPSPGGEYLRKEKASSLSISCLHNILVNGLGPDLATTNGITEIGRISEPGWCYVGLDFRAAFRSRLKEFTRGIIFVEPDLFIVCDHFVAEHPSVFQMFLHPFSTTSLDSAWGDLRLESLDATLRIHSPAFRKKPRTWERVDCTVDRLVPGTVTMRLGPTNKLEQLDLLTVFAVHKTADKRDYTFRLLESDSAVGARIHRDGLPTLVAFKTSASTTKASLTGFEFTGLAGVSVYLPKAKR